MSNATDKLRQVLAASVRVNSPKFLGFYYSRKIQFPERSTQENLRWSTDDTEQERIYQVIHQVTGEPQEPRELNNSNRSFACYVIAATLEDSSLLLLLLVPPT